MLTEILRLLDLAFSEVIGSRILLTGHPSKVPKLIEGPPAPAPFSSLHSECPAALQAKRWTAMRSYELTRYSRACSYRARPQSTG